MGKKVWEEINLVKKHRIVHLKSFYILVYNSIFQAFDAMPIAAVVDGKIFCVHGGIPPPWMEKSIHALNQVFCGFFKKGFQNCF
jgi:diadenosine tetraphosphatase ApaH/serine/threonine PP2A family protein phosphatase